MIPSPALRFGNYFMEDGEVKRVTAHTFNSVVYEDLQPLPLTPELLKCCGFIRHSDTLFDKGKFRLSQTDNGFAFRWGITPEYTLGSHATLYDYLHEIQNIYYALTGEEIEMNTEEKSTSKL